MLLCIQDPTDSSSEYLIDTLLDACEGATRGAGAFAFLSAGGVRLFLQDSTFVEFATKGAFELIVGVDAITDGAAISALDSVRSDLPSVAALVHIPSHPRSIFHPKFAWFEKADGGVLITGSGNLTAGGLRWNVETYNVTLLDKTGIAAVSAQWEAFKARSAGNLFSTDDPVVVEKLKRNAERRKTEREAPAEGGTGASPQATTPVEIISEVPTEETANVDVVPTVESNFQVLVAEIPQSGNRWKQANFDIGTFVNFFGASRTIARRAYFFHVREDGTVGHQEVRPAVTVASQNYRFELEAASGLPYPSNGRPIGVFVRVATRTFIYSLLMPGESGHAAMEVLLHGAVPNPGQRMRRIVFSADDVQAAWPNSPLWRRLTI